MSASRKAVAAHVQVSATGTFSVSAEHLLKSERVRHAVERAAALRQGVRGQGSSSHTEPGIPPTDPPLRIPVKPITCSVGKPITHSGHADHLSERSDAGTGL